MPFEKARQMLECLLGVQVSEATVRRLTERSGKSVEAAQNREQPPAEPAPAVRSPQRKMALSTDGASILSWMFLCFNVLALDNW